MLKVNMGESFCGTAVCLGTDAWILSLPGKDLQQVTTDELKDELKHFIVFPDSEIKGCNITCFCKVLCCFKEGIRSL
eukprot:1521251-Ditylum_brightwellii.AAC.2